MGFCLSACATLPPDGSIPIAIEYRLASFSSGMLPSELRDLDSTSCLSGEESETLEFVYPSGRQIAVDVSSEKGFELDVHQGEVALQEMPLDDGLQVAALAHLTVDERRMKKARKFRARFERCELVVLIDGVPADLLVGAKAWNEGLPGGRFPTMDQAREIYQREGMAITVVPEAMEVTRWRQQFRLWQAYQARWRFRCDAGFREAMRQSYPDTYEQLEKQDGYMIGLKCSQEPKPPPRPNL
jgi:hypothetical protein